MRGRKPELKSINGALSHIPDAPDWLPAPGRSEWQRVTPALVRRRVLSHENLATLEHYCLAVGLVQQCHAVVAAQGPLLDNKRHPALASLFQALAESRRLAAELGLTPASRSKVDAGDFGEDDELSEMIGAAS